MIQTHCLLAHIRAATQGAVSIENTHPFHFREFLMMQNGGIKDFIKIKRRMINRLDEEFFQWVYGQTDTQYIFALFLTIAKENRVGDTAHTLEKLTMYLSQTFAEIEEMKKVVHLSSPSVYNLVLTNGNALVATRYSTQPDKDTRSLHIAHNGECYTCDEGLLRFRASDEKDRAVLISSEVLSAEVDFWQDVPENHSITVSDNLQVEINPLI